MTKYLLFSIAFLSLSLPAFSKPVVFCTHVELCKIFNQLSSLESENLIKLTGDPHEFEPTILDIKKLIDAPVLISGPNELNPWMKKILFQRSKNKKLVTISLLFDSKELNYYKPSSPEALSHFWLYPQIYCSFKNKMKKHLSDLLFKLSEDTDCDFKILELKIQLALTKVNYPIILTHDALLPILQSLNKKQEIIALKSSDHHSETDPHSIKKMYHILKAPKVIWIQETGINIPQNIYNKIRPNDIVIKIDTSKDMNQEPFSTLNYLVNQLNNSSDALK
jgi:hypothetical protein